MHMTFTEINCIGKFPRVQYVWKMLLVFTEFMRTFGQHVSPSFWGLGAQISTKDGKFHSKTDSGEERSGIPFISKKAVYLPIMIIALSWSASRQPTQLTNKARLPVNEKPASQKVDLQHQTAQALSEGHLPIHLLASTEGAGSIICDSLQRAMSWRSCRLVQANTKLSPSCRVSLAPVPLSSFKPWALIPSESRQRFKQVTACTDRGKEQQSSEMYRKNWH